MDKNSALYYLSHGYTQVSADRLARALAAQNSKEKK